MMAATTIIISLGVKVKSSSVPGYRKLFLAHSCLRNLWAKSLIRETSIMPSNYGMNSNPFTCQIVTASRVADGKEKETMKALKRHPLVDKRDVVTVKSTSTVNSFSEFE